MNKSDIATMLKYNFWANKRILAACENLSADEFIRPVTPDPGWGSLRGILVHTLDVEFGWRSNLQKLDASKILEPSDFPDIPSLKAQWAIEEKAWFDYLADLDDAKVNQVFQDDGSTRFFVWHTIMHVTMHSMQHRSEAAIILTGYGHSPGEIDFGIYLSQSLS